MPSVAQYVEAIQRANGLISVAARSLGVTRRAVYKARDRHEKIRQAIEDARETTLDFAEGKLIEQIKSGNTTALIFFLKTQGKQRGYIERAQYQRVPDLDLDSMTDEELEAVARGELPDGS